ncbi:GNAT family N-acetyltransferase [Desnuesiella massiliensis]|uniref:GNAT family N-acetyltransferase n=1 Tax=Desnuesiella massiliensis TaxID=1650662 RepID=UPI0006E180DB|nr:GNAT family protein [Desnuesiella massiliensis]
MVKEKNISIELSKGTANEYMIKDLAGITIGRFVILEMDKVNRNCTIRMKFYREENSALLKEALAIILRTVFKNKEVYKINMLAIETINTKAFLDLGFQLEGILEDNIFSNGIYKSEFIFGITALVFKNFGTINVFSIKGARVNLKVLTPENSEEVLNYYIRNKEHLKNFEPSREESFYSLEVQRNILMENYKQFLNGTSLNLGIYKENTFIGKVQLSNIVYGVFRSAFVGYSIDESYQGKGYMKEGLKLLLDYAFEEMELHRIEASTLVDNMKSQGVLKACGFKELGVNKEYLFINGAWRDHITFYRIHTGG